jgi:hypothetical protein
MAASTMHASSADREGITVELAMNATIQPAAAAPRVEFARPAGLLHTLFALPRKAGG